MAIEIWGEYESVVSWESSEESISRMKERSACPGLLMSQDRNKGRSEN